MGKRKLHTVKTKTTFTLGAQKYGIYVIPMNLEHVGKVKHNLYVDFKVHQTANSQNNVDVYFMGQTEYFDWQNLILPLEISKNVFKTPDTAFSIITKSMGEELSIKIQNSGMLYLIFDNRHSILTRKNIQLEFWETWDDYGSNDEMLFTIPTEDESLKDEIERMIDESQESLLIISPFCDMTFISQLLNAKDTGIIVRIILRDNKDIKGLAKDGLEQIKKKFPNNYKLNKNIHSRMVICDNKEIIVSSADLDQKSLQSLLNIGIKTSNKKLVKKAISFFEQVWST